MRNAQPGSPAGFVLAGDRSSRMGQGKALLRRKGSTLIESVAREVFLTTVACGMPRVTRIPKTPAGLEPLCALHHARLWPAVESAIQSNSLKIHDFVSTIQARLWPAPDPSLFRNLNTPEQLSETR